MVYQTLCFEFSSQLMDKLSSSSFFKLTQSDISNIKGKRATDVVKKWFEYLNVKSNKTTKVAQIENNCQEVTPEEGEDSDIQEFYDMDELMEHRIFVEDDERKFAEQKIRYEGSILKSKYLLNEYEEQIKDYAINDNDALNMVYAKQRNVALVRENESAERKRLAILSEIFRCLNEKHVRIPDVTKELESLRRCNIMDTKNIVDATLPLIAQRYAAYLIVAKRAKQLISEMIRELEKDMIESAGIVGQLRRQHEVQILKNADVVGKLSKECIYIYMC